MKQANHNEAWLLLVERKTVRKENRTAFIAALLMARSRDPSRANVGVSEELQPHLAEAFAVELVRLATAIHGLCVAACNYELSKPQESRLANLEERFEKLAGFLGFEARTAGDPRGACAYLIDPDERKGDGWGEGWAVYA